MKKLKGLSIIFPFFNDEATVARQITFAYLVGKEVADDFEVIAVNGGRSRDRTFEEIKKMKKIYQDLKIINRENNHEGYAVIKHGLKAATKDWIFYTDGDAQYHLEEDLVKLVQCQMKTKATVINGYKIKRKDNILRIIFGGIYKFLSKFFFNLPIRDVDCDFRLIKKSLLDKIKLKSRDSSILPELIKKLELAGASFSEVPVSHYQRIYGKSNYSIFTLAKEKIFGDIKLYFALKKIKK